MARLAIVAECPQHAGRPRHLQPGTEFAGLRALLDEVLVPCAHRFDRGRKRVHLRSRATCWPQLPVGHQQQARPAQAGVLPHRAPLLVARSLEIVWIHDHDLGIEVLRARQLASLGAHGQHLRVAFPQCHRDLARTLRVSVDDQNSTRTQRARRPVYQRGVQRPKLRAWQLLEHVAHAVVSAEVLPHARDEVSHRRDERLAGTQCQAQALLSMGSIGSIRSRGHIHRDDTAAAIAAKQADDPIQGRDLGLAAGETGLLRQCSEDFVDSPRHIVARQAPADPRDRAHGQPAAVGIG